MHFGVYDTKEHGCLQQAMLHPDELLKTSIRGDMRQNYLYFGLLIYPLSKHSRASMLLVYTEGARGTPDTHLAPYACALILQNQNVFRPYIHSSIHSSNRSSIHPSIHPSIHACIHPSIHPSIHPFIDSLACSFVAHSFVCSFIRSFTHSFIHSQKMCPPLQVGEVQ